MVNFNYNYRNDYPDEYKVDFEEFADNNFEKNIYMLDGMLCFDLVEFDFRNRILTYDISENKLDLTHDQILKVFEEISYLSDLFDKFGNFEFTLEKGCVLYVIFAESFV